MKSILLLKVESESVYNPLGLLYVGSHLKNNGYDVNLEIIPSGSFNDLSFIRNKAMEIAKRKYLYVGFSVLTGPQTKFSAMLSKKIKEFSENIPIVWGGIHPSLLSEQVLGESYVDIVVVGEGERTALELADALYHNTNLAAVQGIGYKNAGRLIFNKPRELIKNMDEISIDWSLVDMERCLFVVPGRDSKGFIYLTSRGCPHDCSFCYNRNFNKRRWRTHSIERVYSDISRIKKAYGIDTVAFMDDHFFVDKKRSFEILGKLKNIGVSCSEFLLRVDEITADTVRRLSELGVKRVFIGVESGNDRVLSLMNKNTTRKMILEKFALLSMYKDISVNCAMIIGYPTETMKEIEDSIDLGVKLSEMIPGIVVTYQTFLPYPGTDAYDLALKEGFHPPSRNEDYEIYDTFGDKMPLDWLPWASEKTKQLFFRIDKYGKLLTHSKSTSFIRTLGKNILYHMAKLRLKYRFLAMPFEIFILFKFNRYYNPKCKV